MLQAIHTRAFGPSASAPAATASRASRVAAAGIPEVPMLLPILALVMFAASLIFFETDGAMLSVLGLS